MGKGSCTQNIKKAGMQQGNGTLKITQNKFSSYKTTYTQSDQLPGVSQHKLTKKSPST